MFWRSLVLVGLISTAGACAALKQGAEKKESRQMQAAVVLLENLTSQDMHYRYTEMKVDQRLDARGDTNFSMGIGGQLEDSVLKPSKSVRLRVVPGSNLKLRFTQGAKEKELLLPITEHQTLQIETKTGLKTTKGMPSFRSILP